MFVFHHAMSAIGIINPEDPKRECVLLATVECMQKNGWKVSDGDLRKTLPRIDKPKIVL